jgi:hypothetical protein
MFGLNILFVPMIGIPDGYVGSAWAAFISYLVMMLVSYFVGRHYYPLPYEIKRMGLYLAVAAISYFLGEYAFNFPTAMWLTYTLRIVLLLGYIVLVALLENVPLLTPLIKRLMSKLG